MALHFWAAQGLGRKIGWFDGDTPRVICHEPGEWERKLEELGPAHPHL
jgi:hypothetical protein